MASFRTMIAALLAGSLAATAGGMAYAKADDRADSRAFDPARYQEHLTQRIDKALSGTDATAEQKRQIADILGQSFKDMRAMNDQRTQNRKAMTEALQAPTIDAAKIESIRAEQMKIADSSSQRFTKALTDAANVLTVEQRQAFFKNWSEREHGPRGKRG